MKKRGIGSHTNPVSSETVYLTPPQILRELGTFNMDPCSAPAPRPWDTATNHIELPQDGLLTPWLGRIWLNPPYDSNIDLWLEKMARHRNGIALLFARTEIEAWKLWVWPHCEGILFIAGRLHFYLPDGSRMRGNAGGPSALVAYSAYDASVLLESQIPGAFVEVRRH